MDSRRSICFLMAMCATAALATGAWAQDKGAGEKKDEKKGGDKPAGKTEGAEQEAQAMSPEQQAMMANWMAYATPGEHHKALEPLIGNWACDITMWWTPDTEPEHSKGTLKRTWIHGGRFIMEEASGDPEPDMPEGFAGLGIFGYDNYLQKYTGSWTDNMGTGTMYWMGTADASDKTFTYTSDAPDFEAGPGKMKKTKSILRIINNDKQVYEMYDTGKDGKEFKNFEMVCTRK